MITFPELDELAGFQTRRESPILSVYLNVDQARMENLSRGFERILDDLLRKQQEALATEEEKEAFSEDAARVRSFVGEYRPTGKTLVLFCDASRDFFWFKSLRVSHENEVNWDLFPHLRSLIEARDEFQRYGVILTDRGQTRLFTISMREIEEDLQFRAKTNVRRSEAPGRDHARSQMQFQRKAEEHAKHHLKELSLPFHAGPDQVRDATLEMVEHVEREEEKRLVDQLITAAAKNQQAVTGLSSTLDAAQEGRIRRLVYTEGYHEHGNVCLTCDALFDGSRQVCLICNKGLQPVGQLLDRLLEKTCRKGGETEQVRQEAAGLLMNKAEGIGAFLRF